MRVQRIAPFIQAEITSQTVSRRKSQTRGIYDSSFTSLVQYIVRKIIYSR
jgi:hypothetical protein